MRVVKRKLGIACLTAVTLLPSAFAQNTTFTSASAGNWQAIVAPDSIVAGFGTGFSTTTTSITSLPLPTNLGNVTISITDSSGTKLSAPMFVVSPGQINYLIPAGAALGKASVSVSGNNQTFTGTLEIANISPAIFTANNNGAGVPAAQLINVSASGAVTNPSPFQTGVLSYVTNPIDLSSGNVFLVLYGTGLRRRSGNPVRASIGGISVPVAFAGPQGSLPGLDQINLGPLPQTLSGGKGDVDLVITVDGIQANITRIRVK